MQIFAQITKVDDKAGLVYGRAVAEEVDNGNEIFDYETSKPEFQAWSQKVAKATGGKSVGNVRAMHQLNAVGKLNEITFLDDERAIDVCAEVVDPVELDKCRKGVYTGFSIGGRYARKWDDPVHKGAKRYTARPNEISLVDLPCVGTAQFTVVKADGTEELRKFQNNADDDEAMIKWFDALPRERVQGLLKRLGVDSSDPDLAPYMAGAERIAKHGAEAQTLAAAICAATGQPVLAKGLYTVSRFAEILASLAYMVDDTREEAIREADGSPVPAQIQAALKPLVAAFLAMAAEEAAEALHTDQGVMTMSDKDQLQKTEAGELRKALDAANARIEALEKAMPKAETPEERLAKALGENETLTKALGERDDLLTKAAERIETLTKAFEKLSKEPVPPRAALTAVSKSADGAAELGREVEPVKKADGTVDQPLTELKKALSQPVRVR